MIVCSEAGVHIELSLQSNKRSSKNLSTRSSKTPHCRSEIGPSRTTQCCRTAPCGKLSLPHCGPYQVIELNHNAHMAKLQVIRGHDKWVRMQWLSRCDPKMLDRKQVEPWYSNYKDCCSLQAIPDKDKSTTGDSVSAGDQFSQRWRGAPEKHHCSEEKLQQKLKESEALVDQS